MTPCSTYPGKLIGSLALVAIFFGSAEVALSQELTWREIEQAGSEHLMTVTAPPGYTAEDVLETILENPKLPAHIRQPYLELAQRKAPHLLRQADGSIARR